LLNVYVWRHNGLLVASLVLAACWLAFRSDWRRMAVVTLIAVGGLMAVKGPLYSALDAWPTPALQSHATLIHDMGAFLTHHESSFSPAELSFLETILPLERWTAGAEGRYDCRQATGLIFAPDLYPVTRYDPTGQLVSIRDIDPVLYQNPDSNELTANLDRFRSIWWKAVRQHPLTFLGHRLCVSASAWSPVSLFGESPLVPGRTMADNDLGLRTTPLTPGLKSVLDWYVGVWNSLRVVAWRPAWILYPGFVAAALGWRRLRDRFPDAWLVQVTGLAAWVSVVLVTPGQSFRYVWPAYLCAWAAFAFFARSRT
ncbi:MAG: hypothetical protein R3246_17095, partial [Acidimicrobiia bacterium]|nr:hypothetical protein [Acidimicrobiia bacterium]